MKPNLLLIGRFNDRMMARFQAGFTTHQLGEADLDAIAGDITAVATNIGIKPEVMAALPALKVISSFGVGYDSIDAVTAAERGILVAHTPDVLNDEVADTTIMLWLAVSRRLVVQDAYVRAGRWEKEGAAPLTRSVQNRTVGIVGMGRIGQVIADRAAMFKATVLYHTRTKKDLPYRYFPDLVEMARESDVLVVITPGGAETRHLINADVMNALGPDGILINVARGTVVDEAALVAALSEGRLGGAGLDVFEHEPKVSEALYAMENVVLQPHVGSATVETRQAMGDLVCDNLDQFLKDGTVLRAVPECAALNTPRQG